MSTHCFKRLLGTFLIGTAFSLAGSTPALADNPSTQGLFELDGNTVPNNAAAPIGPAHDWDQMVVPPAQPGDLGAKASTGILADTSPKVFTQGSKDTADLTGWAWRSGSSPSKADIQDAYAAAYDDGSNPTHLIAYFGANRLSVNGTVAAGFWFFKSPVCALPNGTFGAGAADSTGACVNLAAGPAHHTDGDTLVAVNYDNGGHVGTIAIYKWVGGPTGTLTNPFTSTNTGGLPGLFCGPASGALANTACGTTNTGNITTAWADLTGNSNLVPGQFFEGGIDLTALNPTGGNCFASFLATSRSSTTVNAETKNFLLGNFPVCKLDVTKTCSFLSLVSQTQAKFTVTGQVTNSGGGTLNSISLTDVPALDANSAGFFTCDASGQPTSTPTSNASLAPGAAICYSATITGAQGVSTFGDDITAHGTSGTAMIDSASAHATCTAVFQGLPTLTKNCTTCLDDTSVSGHVVLNVGYAGQLCNANSFPFTNVTIKDLAEGTDASATVGNIVVTDTASPPNTLTNGTFTLAAGTAANPTCVNYTGSYAPFHALNKTTASGNTLNPDLAQSRDTISATGTAPFGVPNQALVSQPASCNLCIDPTNHPARCGS